MKIFIRFSILCIAGFLFFSQCGRGDNSEEPMSETTETEEQAEPSLTRLWETPEEMTTCESVLFDENSGTIYVSNINGDPSAKNGTGFISTITADGKIIESEWVADLHAPKGMGVQDGNLYVTDVDELVEIDIASASVSEAWPVEGAEFLNDVATGDGKVYFSDSNAGTIYVLENGEVSTFAEGQDGINGLRVDSNGNLYGLSGEGLKKYNNDGSSEIVNDVVTGGDGLIILDEEEGMFLASRWQGEIWIIMGDEEIKLLDTKEEESNTADIGYIPEDNLVLVPTFFKNKVAGYRLEY